MFFLKKKTCSYKISTHQPPSIPPELHKKEKEEEEEQEAKQFVSEQVAALSRFSPAAIAHQLGFPRKQVLEVRNRLVVKHRLCELLFSALSIRRALT